MTETEQLQQRVAVLETELAAARTLGERTARDRDAWHNATAAHQRTIEGLQSIIEAAAPAMESLRAARDRLQADVFRLERDLDTAEHEILALQDNLKKPANSHPPMKYVISILTAALLAEQAKFKRHVQLVGTDHQNAVYEENIRQINSALRLLDRSGDPQDREVLAPATETPPSNNTPVETPVPEGVTEGSGQSITTEVDAADKVITPTGEADLAQQDTAAAPVPTEDPAPVTQPEPIATETEPVATEEKDQVPAPSA
jgi:hypothetical protein